MLSMLRKRPIICSSFLHIMYSLFISYEWIFMFYVHNIVDIIAFFSKIKCLVLWCTTTTATGGSGINSKVWLEKKSTDYISFFRKYLLESDYKSYLAFIKVKAQLILHAKHLERRQKLLWNILSKDSSRITTHRTHWDEHQYFVQL